jgi:hypothetical protein
MSGRVTAALFFLCAGNLVFKARELDNKLKIPGYNV